jgi:hypothetical protein
MPATCGSSTASSIWSSGSSSTWVFLLAALYFFLIGGQPIIGAVLLAIAVGALGYGILSTPQIARDIGRALENKPETS